MGCAGLGYWGPNIVRSVFRAQGAELVAICDVNPESLDRVGSLYEGVTKYSSLESMLQDDQVDAVTIATPAPLHFEMAKQVLESGRHCFVEKPITLDSREAEQLVSIADECGLTLMVGHLMQYHGAIDYLRTMIKEGELGEVHYVYTQRLNLGKVRAHENAFWSLAPHDLSMILYLLGEVPCSVSANGSHHLRRGIEDVVFAALQFASGKTAHIHVSWLDPHKTRKLTVVGSKKMAVFDDMQPMYKVMVYDRGVVASEVPEYGEDLMIRFGDIHTPRVAISEPLLVEMEHFAEACTAGSMPRSSGHDGLNVVRLLEAVEVSMRAGGSPVAIGSQGGSERE